MDERTVKTAKKARNAYARKWRKENPDKVREINLRYWARRAEREEAAQKEQTEVQNDG